MVVGGSRTGVCIALIAMAAACGRTGPPTDDFDGSTTPTPAPTPTAPLSLVTLIDESFDAGSNGLLLQTVVDWDDGELAPFEVYSSGAAGNRGMSAFYDHDNDDQTADVAIPGGIEINANASDLTLVATVTLPPPPPPFTTYVGGTMTVWAGERGNPGGSQQIEVFDVDGNVVILPDVVPTTDGGGAPRPWTFNTVAIPLTGANSGHVLEFRFKSSGNGGEGLQLADLLVTATPQ